MLLVGYAFLVLFVFAVAHAYSGICEGNHWSRFFVPVAVLSFFILQAQAGQARWAFIGLLVPMFIGLSMGYGSWRGMSEEKKERFRRDLMNASDPDPPF